jgi:hypothetical protein
VTLSSRRGRWGDEKGTKERIEITDLLLGYIFKFWNILKTLPGNF